MQVKKNFCRTLIPSIDLKKIKIIFGEKYCNDKKFKLRNFQLLLRLKANSYQRNV